MATNRYIWTRKQRGQQHPQRITVDAANREAAIQSFNEIRATWFPETSADEWTREGFTEQKVTR